MKAKSKPLPLHQMSVGQFEAQFPDEETCRAYLAGNFSARLLRAGEAPRLLAYDEHVGCSMEMALTALEWTGAVGVLHDSDLVHAARLTSETASCVIERRTETGSRQFVYLGPRMDAPIIDVFEGNVLYDEPGVRAVEFAQRAHALAHFLRATPAIHTRGMEP